MGTISAMDAAWKPVKIGAGGWVTGIDVAPDGTMVARTDTYGAYIWNGTGWNQIITSASMPEGTLGVGGVYEIRVAASNSNIFYMEMGDGIYKSVDKGQTWVKTAFPATPFDANSAHRMDGQKMAIDPTNPDVVYAGTQSSGLWVTRNGGTTWQKISAVPQGTGSDPALTGITIKGSTIYVGTGGSGVYTSTDGGNTWKGIGGPADVANAAIASDGSYFAASISGGALWKYSNGTWAKLIADSVHGVAVDPFDPSHIVVTGDGGNIQESKDGGSTWSGWNWNNKLESSDDVAWLETAEGYMSSGGLVFDPIVQGKLWQSAGTGVWSTGLTNQQLNWSTPVVWNSHSMGIEQLVGNEVIAGAGSDPVFASWDRPFFDMANPDSYATNYGGGTFSAGWSIDYASSDPRFMVGISDWWGQDNSGYSTDGGKSWQKFAGLPSWAMDTVGGSIAASTSTNFVWVATGNQPPAYTLDGGKTWANINIPGITDWSGLHHFYYLDRTAVTADRVLANTFYLSDPYTGIYKTSDGGVTWAKVFNGQPASWSYWNAKIEAVPGSAGELFFTSGPQGSANQATEFMHSKDGGASWQIVTGVNAGAFGYGAPATAGGPATVYVVGTVNGVYGIWFSTDDAKTWTQIGEHPMGSLDQIRTISGDMDQFGRVFVGFGGSGYAYLDVQGGGNVAPTPVSPTPMAPTQTVAVVEAFNDAKGAAIAAGSLTNDKTPVLKGSLSSALTSDQSVAVYRDGQKIGIATISGSSWSFTDPGATDGSHNYTAQVVSTNGLSGLSSAAFNLRVDATAPTQGVAVTAAVDDFGPATGTLGSGAVTDDKSPLIKGTLSAALGADETLVVYRDGVRLGTATVSGNSWSYADSNVAEGNHSYVARVEDAAGNQGSTAAAFALQVKSNAPGQSAAIKHAVDDFGSMKGNLLSGATTDDTSPLLKGTLSGQLNAGEQLVIYRDGVRVGAASVTGTEWSFADKGVGKGAHVYTSHVEDSAGQKSAASASFYLTVSNQKGVKAAVMSSSTLSSVEPDVATTVGRTGQVDKYALAASDLLDTSPLLGTGLTVTSPSPDMSLDIKKAAVQTSLKFAEIATFDVAQAVGEHGTDHSFASHGIDLIGNTHHYNVPQWFA